jgi:ectoine hydroxylase-related dioxygenase (phytanoyl-CoA dioxygenase family)
VDDVFGAGVWTPVADQLGGLAAPNLPIRDAPWSVPHTAWHVDEPTSAAREDAWGLLGFAFLDAVEPAGGATVALAGSHRRLRALAASTPGGLVTTDEAIAALGTEPWFADLLRPGDPGERRRRFVDEGQVSMGIPLRVVELVGEPGDLVLMDPRCLHTVSANVSRRPRLTMRTICQRLA